jgi:D-lactate dehydrogenase
MKILVYSAKKFEEVAFTRALKNEMFKKITADVKLELTFVEARLTPETAPLAKGFEAVCLFVTDHGDRSCIQKLSEAGVKLILLRSAGFNHVAVAEAKRLGIKVLRVPRYSPEAVAEFSVGLYLCLNRKIHRAHDRVREGNFSIEGLMGHNIAGQTIGIIGTGNIGRCVAQIYKGFGAHVVAYDTKQDLFWSQKTGVTYVGFQELLENSNVVSLHVPLNESTRHLLNAKTFEQLKPKAYLINTSRGALVETDSLIAALKSCHLSGAALDVYEEEENLFFKDMSEEIIHDDRFSALKSYPNVLITSHQAFLTEEAVAQITATTLQNACDWHFAKPLANEVI